METLLLCFALFLKNYYHLITKTAIIGMFHHSHHLNSVVALPKDRDKNNLHLFCQAAKYFQALQLNPTNVPGYSWKDILSEVPVGVDFAFFA